MKPSASARDPLREALEEGIGFQYRIDRLLGRGGMGAVYLAHELALDRPVAIKVLPPDRSDEAMRERFKREARTAARLTHSGIVPLHTFGEVKGLLYFVMGYVDGESLASRLARRGRLDSGETLRILGEVADALDYAHRHGVVHRDVKPDNVLIERQGGRAVLADFGIAKAGQHSTSLTGTHIIGTPHYMSPEQASGLGEVDGRSDLYSVGVMAYAMLSGRLPFEGTTPGEVLVKHLKEEPPPLGSIVPDAPAHLVSAVTRCLAKDPARRWPDAQTLRRALLASDSEVPEEEDEISVMRLGVLGGAALLAFRSYSALLRRAAPDWDLVPTKETALLLGGLAVFMIVFAAARLRHRNKTAWRAMVRATLQQPEWWGTWYPSRFRRPGDIWHRLPQRIRRFHVAVGLTAAVFLFVSLPLLALAVASWSYAARTGQPSPAFLEQASAYPFLVVALSAVLYLPFVALAALVVEYVLHRRHLISTLGPSLADPSKAEKALVMPSWKRSFWGKPPFDSLLLPEQQATSQPRAAEPTAGSPDAATMTRSSEAPPREG